MGKTLQNFMMLLAGIGAVVIFIVLAWAGIQVYRSQTQEQLDKVTTVFAEINND